MVNDSLHIICGNCGHNHEYNNFTFEYQEIESCGDEIINSATVYITCNNCSTVHSLDKYAKEETQ
jgi:RNase P subunit RPR2